MENQQTKKPTKRVLVLADFACATGFAQVAHNVAEQILMDQTIDYSIDVVGINYYGMPTDWQRYYPRIRVFPAMLISQNDMFGRFGFMQLLSSGVYDIVWILQDTFIIETLGERMQNLRKEMIEKGKKPFKFIYYFPIDAEPKENWIKKSVSTADVPVAYTQYGYDEAVKKDPTLITGLKVIPHGVDTAVFHPIPKEDALKFRSHYFEKMADGKFLITNVNRNQPRKDIARTMQIFRLFKNQVPEALLYLHMRHNDVAYNLKEVAREFELIEEKDYIIPPQFDEHDGAPLELVNMIYNASDVIMTTSLGEGWGLSMTEAMACKTPVIAPNHSSLAEILGEGRGTLVSAGSTPNDWIVMQSDNERKRPVVNVAEYVEKLVHMYRFPDEAKAMAETAYQHVTTKWTWNEIGKQWREAFAQPVAPVTLSKVGRNDPCWCGSGQKSKKCHGGGYGGA